ncbi:hypothetical protein [Cellvibrio polysaccharolyticus]|uniref:hypothetical protein n=1 Tax=Cellvibrio polysaccharolyticus TaxID=2082724 RepID=UPI00187F6C51|nr:hypothetical protein [Cellvibrio polysaccharolyticus]
MLRASNKAMPVPAAIIFYNPLILLKFMTLKIMKKMRRGKAAMQSGKLLPPASEQKITTGKAANGTEDRRQKTEDRRQKTEDRRQKTEDRRTVEQRNRK